MGQTEAFLDRIEAGSRRGIVIDILLVSEPESTHMSRTGGHKITIFGFFKILS